MKKLLILSLLSITLLSCEKVIDYKLPDEPSKLVVDAPLYTGTVPELLISTSVPVSSLAYPSVSGQARVALYQDGMLIDSLRPNYSNGDTTYRGSHEIEAGHHYRLEVSQNGYSSVFASDRSPSLVPIDTMHFDGQRGTLSLEFSDPSSPNDYYSISAYYKQNGGYQYPIYLTTYEALLENFEGSDDPFSSDGAKSGDIFYLSDENVNGRSLRFDFRDIYTNDFDTLIVELSHISEASYLHARSVAAYYNSEGNPFAEPVPVYSNIENGYGSLRTATRSEAQVWR